MKNSSILLISLIYIIAINFSYANPVDKCQVSYKACMQNLFLQLEPYANTYGIMQEECNKNISEWEELEYLFVNCQDKYNSCKGNEINIWDRMHQTPDISLEVANPLKKGLSNNKLKNIENEASSITNLRSLLIARDGALLFEDYYDLSEEPKPHHVWSVTKSITSLLVGIAIDKGYLESEDLLIQPYFTDYYSRNHDKRKANITIKHALTMSTGIDFTDSNNWDVANNYLQYWRDDNAHDWILNKEMLLNNEPGDLWLYGTPNIDLLSSILTTVSDQTVLEFAEKYLFTPLDIKNYAWKHDSSENYMGGFALYLRPRALVRIGQMVLDGGIYNGNQVISEDWLEKSLLNQFPLGGEQGWEYGYLWWRFRVGAYQVISAIGWGGQFITLVPSLDLLVVTTSNANLCSTKEQDDQFNQVMSLVKNIILSVK